MKRTPGGVVVTHAKRRKKKEKNRCEICSAPIKISTKKSKALANVCNACTSRISFIKAKVMGGAPLEGVELRYKNYIKKL
jgi:DNA-directed RNA polymerase subunit RPC12/RpoP